METDETSTPDLNTVLETYAKAVAALESVTAKAVLQAFAAKFQANPAVKCLFWRQYTPYFNDGDPCEFSAHDAECRSRFPTEDEGLSSWDVVVGKAPPVDNTPYPKQEYASDFLSYYEYKDPLLTPWSDSPAPESEQGKAVEALRNGLPDSLLQRVFGDGVTVFVWEGGILTQDYSHD